MKSTHPYARAWFAAAALLLSLSGCNAGEPQAAEPDPYANVSPKEPIAIPFPLDKAGFEVDTTFWVVPGVPKGRSSNHHVGLHMFFTPGDPEERIKRLEESQVKVRVTLHRIENGVETKVPIRHIINTEEAFKPPKYIAEDLPDDIGQSRGQFSQGSTTDKTPNSALYVSSFGGVTLPPGKYHLRATTLSDLPSLSGIPTNLVFEHGFLSK